MRELKFRLWDKEQKKFFEPTYEAYKGKLEDISISLSGELLRRTLKYPSEHESRFPERYIINQFTGLKDKNGKEIYEGDIIKVCDGSINLQPWFRPNHVVKYEVNGFNIPKWMYNQTDSTHWCELIGNIHQNKDLIKTL